MKRLAILAVLALFVVGGLATQASAQQTVTLTTTMTGAQEVPPADPDGIGTAVITLNLELGQVCWSLEVHSITLPATASHIHVAPVGVSGPIVIPLSPPDATGRSHGCTAADRALISAIIHHPDQYYVNVHTTDFPGGAIRGQLG